MCQITNHNAEIKILDDKPKGVYYRVANTKKMNNLGYKFSTTIEEGINNTINHLINS